MAERSNLAIEIEAKYPGLEKAVSIARRATTGYFSRFRHDTHAVIPPLLLCDAERLNQEVDHVTAESRYRDDLVRGFAHFQPLEGVVYVAKEEVQSVLRKGPQGVQQIAMVIAEEFTHALTTFKSENTTRTGFMVIPYGSQPHGLKPGAIYEHELESYSEESDDDIIQLPLGDQLLTENATKFLLHGLLGDLQTQYPRKAYPYMAVTTNHGRTPTVIEKSPSVQDLVALSLIKGDKRILKKPFDGRLLPLLENPQFHIGSLAQLPPKDNDIWVF